MAELKIEQLSEAVYYLPGGVNCLIVSNASKGSKASEAVLVDTGQDKDSGRRIKKACAALNVVPRAIINTHAHADHYGGNAFLLNNFDDLTVYGSPFESAIMQEPFLEPMYLYSGAAPPKELMSKWLLANASRVDEQLVEGELTLFGISFKLLDTSGHAHRHFSVQIGNVLFASDALFGAAVLEKYPLAFGQNIAKQIQSAENLASSDAKLVLPGHGEVVEDIASLSAQNVACFNHAAEVIQTIVSEGSNGLSTENVLKATADQLNITMQDLPRYYLNKCVVMAYLSYLKTLERIVPTVENNQLVWKAI